MSQRAISPKPRGDTVRQRVYLELRRTMEQGSFQPGTRLPPSREQACMLGVSRNSVLWAMERLQSEGYVVAPGGRRQLRGQRSGRVAPERTPTFAATPDRRGIAATKQRQQVLIDALAQATRGQLVLQSSEQGLHLLHELPARADDTSLSARAQAAGLLLAPLSRYCIASKRRGGLFGYAGYDTAALRSAASKLGRML